MRYNLLNATAMAGGAIFAATFALSASETAMAQMSESSQENSVPEQAIVVTGSRLMANGFEAPTPTTVLGQDQIETVAPNNIADVVNRLPQFNGSATPRTNVGQISNGGTGINALNLRNLGASRTLILLDGKRVPVATINTGLVDVNFMPNLLVKSVEVVTGGASAAWGSDAVSGVVNFVLDTEFTGFKGDVQGGITTYGDNENYRIGLAAGTKFADGRGHLMVSAERAYNAGLKGWDRNWYHGTKRFANPNYAAGNGQPEYLVLDNVGFSTVAPGAIVVDGPLAGTYFGEGGKPAQLGMGDIVKDPFMTGPDWRYSDFGQGIQDMDPRISRWTAFARASYEVTDDISLYGQFSMGRATTSMRSTPQFNFGGITIYRDNAFLDSSIADRMDELGLDSLNVGSYNADLGGIKTNTKRSQYRYLIGLQGGVDALGTHWRWDISANRNISKIFNGSHATITANYRSGIDAVLNDAGEIVCRSALNNPASDCIPYNILGTGTVSEAAKAYVLGDNWLHGKLTQDVLASSITGEPFSTWAGPVSVAFGMDYRREKLKSRVDELSLSNAYWAGNYKPINGKYEVTEFFLETLIPLARDTRWAKDLSINGAIRATDYSTSGAVKTWKIGLNYEPVDGLRFRATRSRDIRAGNFSELYAAGQTNTYLINDPFRDNASGSYFEVRSGNPVLAPEKASTLGIGMVVQPRFLSGFSASIDYFDIGVKDAVSQIGAGSLLDQCYRGDTSLCSKIIRDSNGLITEIHVTPINLAQQKARGLDMEISYAFPLAGGKMTLRSLATHYLEASSNNGLGVRSSSLGTGTRTWQYMINAAYRDDKLTLSLTGRGVNGGKYLESGIECSNDCPISTPTNPTINNNHIAGALYWDGYIGVKVLNSGEIYLSVDNLLNKAPAKSAHGPGIGSAPHGTNAGFYDVIGRSFRAGYRFDF